MYLYLTRFFHFNNMLLGSTMVTIIGLIGLKLLRSVIPVQVWTIIRDAMIKVFMQLRWLLVMVKNKTSDQFKRVVILLLKRL